MRIKFIERIKFKMQGHSVPVINVLDEDIAGRVEVIQLISSAKDRDNSVIFTWDGRGFEKDKENPAITVVDDKGISSRYWVSKGGRAVSLYTRMTAFPNIEKIIGGAATMDDIAESMDLGKSMRNVLIGMILGAGVWAAFIGPILGAILK